MGSRLTATRAAVQNVLFLLLLVAVFQARGKCGEPISVKWRRKQLSSDDDLNDRERKQIEEPFRLDSVMKTASADLHVGGGASVFSKARRCVDACRQVSVS